jgi:hypothetical protein
MIPDCYDPRRRRPRRASSSLAVFVVTILSKAVLVKWKFM